MTRITLRGHERRGNDFLLIFAVDRGNGEVAASVLARPVTGGAATACFPHGLSDSGQGFDATTDAALLERARQTVAVLEAADTWSAMRWRQRRAA